MMNGADFFDPEQGHERDDASLAVVVDPHRDIDVFDRRDEEQGPDDQDRAPRMAAGSGCWLVAPSTVLSV